MDLTALSTTRWTLQCCDGQDGGSVAGREPPVPVSGQSKQLWKTQPSEWLLLPLLHRKRVKVQKNKPVLISNEKLQMENEGKPTSL